MAKAIRVFEVAKELGVPSKTIVEKCKAEGVPGITNHMSTVKVGLLQTIRQWFSEVQEGTAVEVAQKVDVAKVRKTAKRRSATKAPASKAEESAAGDTAVKEQKAPAEEVEEKKQPKKEEEPAKPVAVVQEPEEAAPQAAAEQPPAEQEQPEEAAPAEAPAVAAETQEAPPAEAEQQEKGETSQSVQAAGRPNVPDRPTVVSPAGNKLERPKGAVLRGPNVVRVEQPDPVSAPRPRRGPSQGGGGGGGPMEDRTSDGTVPGISRSRGPARGRGVGGPAKDEPERGKRRPLTSRRGRFAEALPTGPGKYTEQDLIELDARLKRATGFVKQRRQVLRKRESGPVQASPATTGGKVEIAEPIFIKDLSAATGIKSTDIIKYLFKQGIMATINSAIDSEAAQEVAMEYSIELVVKERQTAEQVVLKELEERPPVDVRPRPVVVTVLGHVDHGKTSLLDRIRQADVAAHEAGGITQHVGAYRVTVKAGEGKKTVVFLDTPGHEAFTSMRSRGAKITDVVVLVVAADDGVMPQTVESINHAKAAEVPIIVALNKIDKAEATEANIRKIYGQLAEHGLNPVEWGGTTEIMKVSATEGTGVHELLEVLDYQSELLELKADYGGQARGTVIEAQMQPGRGPVARVLVEQGNLKVGDFIVIGRAFGRVRDMTDEHGRSIREAGPATPLELSGVDIIPDAGDKFYITSSLQQAEQVAQQFRDRERHEQLGAQTKVTLDNFASHVAAGDTKELRVVVKADVQGSIDVLKKSLSDIKNDEVSVRVLHGAVGPITESDVLLADASDAVIIGFHVVASPHVKELGDQRHVDIRLYRIIYEVIDDVKKALEGMLAPEMREQVLGQAEVRDIFKVSKIGTVAGCLVTEGSMQRSGKIRVIRDGVVVTENRPIESLKRVKEDAKEVRSGTECGVKVQGFDDVKPGDTLVCYNTLTVQRKLV